MIASLLLGLIATASQAGQPAPAPAPAPSPPAADKPICRREVPTGSNFARRVCHTKAQWASIDGANQRGAESALENRRANSPSLN